jgi:hypothetical protein
LALHRHLAYVLAFATVLASSAKAHSTLEQPAVPQMFEAESAPEESNSWLDQLWALPIFRFFAPPAALDLTAYEPAAPAVPPCFVDPLPEIGDVEALVFETNVGSASIVNFDGLTPRTAVALNRFERLVTKAGGSVFLTSAYRPAAYQDHLQAVWDKWMLELSHNFDEGCTELRASVRDEFLRHQLLEKQRPASMSDHTRGISFDAAVLIPRGRRRPSVDVLARRAGFHRPVRRSDPVHFRLIAGV